MSDKEFAEKWGDWARRNDRDLRLVRERWISDLEHMLPFAEREEEAVAELVEAKEASQSDPSEANRERRDTAVKTVQDIRFEERANRGDNIRLGGDVYIEGR
jgi:hypothetical protein